MGNGLLPHNFFPKKDGSNFKPSQYISLLGEEIKKKMLVFNGLSHEKLYDHYMEHCILTGVYKSKKDKTSAVSLDTLFGEKLSKSTRFPVVSAWPFKGSFYKTPSITYDHKGLPVAPTKTPIDLYNKLFLNKKISIPKKKNMNRKVVKGQSILDDIMSERQTINRKINISEKQILEEYYDAIREVEKKMAQREAWRQKASTEVKVTKPEVFKQALNLEHLELVQTQVYDLLFLALISGSTNVVSMHYASDDQPLDMLGPDGKPMKKNAHHTYAHHGSDPKKMAGLTKIETTSMKAIAGFVQKLEARKMLADTMVFLSSNLGNSSNHNGNNLPISVIGAGFEKDHNRYYDLRESEKSKVQIPLCNLYQSMLHKIGDQNDKFNIGTGHLKNLKS